MERMSSLVHHIDTPFQKATFGMGCFWASDCLFGSTTGVLRTRVGYSGGTKPNPVYTDLGDHTEVVDIDFDPSYISYSALLELFFSSHEYSIFRKVKNQYKSLILFHNQDQRQAAEIVYNRIEKEYDLKLATTIAPAGIFYPAEDYHQKYRLQSHKELFKKLEITSDLLQRSHVAARLNGYIAGVGEEGDVRYNIRRLGLADADIEYVLEHYRKNQGGNLYC